MFELFEPLKLRNYRLFFFAHLIALLGTGLSTIALALFAYQLDNSRAAEIISFALIAKMTAYVFIAPIVGGFAHKLPHKFVMVVLDIIRAGLLFTLPWVTQTWQIYTIIFLISACSAGFTPLYQATLPNFFKDEASYTQALSLSRAVYDLENILSPSLAALLLLSFNFTTLFQFNAVTFIISASLLGFVIYPKRALTSRVAGIWHNISFGIKSYVKTPRLRGLALFNFIAALAGALVIVNSAHFSQNVFNQTQNTTATLFIAMGLGSLLTSITLPTLLKKISIRAAMHIGAITAFSAIVSFGLFSTLYTMYVAWFMIGIASGLLQTPSSIIIQRSCEKSNLSAFFSAQFTISHLGWMVAYFIAGQLAGKLEIFSAMTLLATLIFIAYWFGHRIWHQSDAQKLTHTHQSVEHLHQHKHDAHHQHVHEGWEGPEPHSHKHKHTQIKHSHEFYIDEHHINWPK